jgi:hypothetical protein
LVGETGELGTGFVFGDGLYDLALHDNDGMGVGLYDFALHDNDGIGVGLYDLAEWQNEGEEVR